MAKSVLRVGILLPTGKIGGILDLKTASEAISNHLM